MNYAKIIEQLQQSILSAQSVLQELQMIDELSNVDVFITRQQAADLLGKSLRQLDRDCVRYSIRRRSCNNGIRVSKRDILVHLGMIEQESECVNSTDLLGVIINKHRY